MGYLGGSVSTRSSAG